MANICWQPNSFKRPWTAIPCGRKLTSTEARLCLKTAAEEEINEALHSATGNSQVIHFAVLIYEALGQRDRAIDVLKGSTPEGIQEITHDRDLAALCRDPRFVRLIAKIQE